MEPVIELGRIGLDHILSSEDRNRSQAYRSTTPHGPVTKLFPPALLHYEVALRSPAWHRSMCGDEGTIFSADEWHHDGGKFSGPKWMLMWTNIKPTEVKLPDGTEIKLKPNVLTLVDNTVCSHRAPYLPPTTQGKRWFLRQHLFMSGPANLTPQKLTRVKAQLDKIISTS